MNRLCKRVSEREGERVREREREEESESGSHEKNWPKKCFFFAGAALEAKRAAADMREERLVEFRGISGLKKKRSNGKRKLPRNKFVLSEQQLREGDERK